MKQLIFTFFAVILCYSLFFDKEKKPAAIDELDYIREEKNSTDVFYSPDTMYYFTNWGDWKGINGGCQYVVGNRQLSTVK